MQEWVASGVLKRSSGVLKESTLHKSVANLYSYYQGDVQREASGDYAPLA